MYVFSITDYVGIVEVMMLNVLCFVCSGTREIYMKKSGKKPS